jgi:hypothetical protein
LPKRPPQRLLTLAAKPEHVYFYHTVPTGQPTSAENLP